MWLKPHIAAQNVKRWHRLKYGIRVYRNTIATHQSKPCPILEAPIDFETQYLGDPMHAALDKLEAHRLIHQTLVYAEGHFPAFTWEAEGKYM